MVTVTKDPSPIHDVMASTANFHLESLIEQKVDGDFHQFN